jgi:hypothetical protein
MARPGAAAVRLPAIGRPSQVDRISPMERSRGVPVSNPPRLRDFLRFSGQLFAFRARSAPQIQRLAGRLMVAAVCSCRKIKKGRLLVDNRPLTWVELRGFEPLTPSMRTRCATGLRYSPKTASQRSKPWGLSAPWWPPRRSGGERRPGSGQPRAPSSARHATGLRGAWASRSRAELGQSPTARISASAYWS